MGRNQWDLFFLNGNGEFVDHLNINTWNYDDIYNQIISIIDNPLQIKYHPNNPSLLYAYPNPFNPSTNITFSIPKSSRSDISIYNLQGRLIETLSQSYFTTGSYTLIWNAAKYTSGIYFVKLNTGSYTISKKIIHAK